MNKTENLTASLITFLLIPVMFVLSASWTGFVFAKLWLWFITPIFHIQPIGVFASAGLAYIAAFLTHQMDFYSMDRKGDSIKDYWALTVASFIRTLIFLIAGWAVHFFV